MSSATAASVDVRLAGVPVGDLPPAVRAVLVDENATDAGNARRFVALFGERVRYLPHERKWLLWRGTADGVQWQRDEAGAVMQLAKATARALYVAAGELADRARGALLARHALALEGEGRLRAMLALAESEPGVAVLRPDALDSDRMLLAVANGTLALGSGTLRDASPADLITRRSPVPYHPDAEAPRWLRFLEQIMDGDAERVAFLQRAVGYALTGRVDEHCLFVLYGLGANGKSVFVATLLALLGDYARTADATAFLERRGDGPRNDIARLAGARVVSASESGSDRRFDEALVKRLTAGDRVSARFLYGEAFEYDPTAKIFLATNHKPVVRGNDLGIWRRLKLVPFNYVVPERDRDPGLADALRDELPGILRWAVDGCLAWQRDRLGAPAAVAAATDAYRAEMDVLGEFFDECCTIAPDVAAPATELWEAYRAWAERHGERSTTQAWFGRQLTDRGHAAETRGTGRERKKWRLGVALADDTSAVSPQTTGLGQLEGASGKVSIETSYARLTEKPSQLSRPSHTAQAVAPRTAGAAVVDTLDAFDMEEGAA